MGLQEAAQMGQQITPLAPRGCRFLPLNPGRALVAKRDKFVAEARDKAPPKLSSFDRVVEDTLKTQIKR